MTDLGKTLRLGDLKGLYKHECGLYLKDAEPWAVEQYGQNGKARGDCIYNSCRKIIEDGDKSAWAYHAMVIIFELLYERKRWLDEVNSYLDSRNWFQYQWSRLQYNLGCEQQMLHRPQRNMSRDCYVYGFALAVYLNRIQFIDAVSVPIHLFRLNLWLWRRSLITGKRSWLYELIERKPNHKEDYVNLLRWYRMKAYKTRTT